MYSALKKDGRALYDYARAGIEVERPARDVTIRGAGRPELQGGEGQEAVLQLDVTCSKGTYIRTLAEDIGEALGLWRTPDRRCGGWQPVTFRPGAQRQRWSSLAAMDGRRRAWHACCL